MKMKKHRYSLAFKEQALLKARQRGERTLEAVAQELNLSLGTLKGWIKRSVGEQGVVLSGPAADFSPTQRLQALLESYPLSGPALSAWCRQKGLFETQLQQWRDAFCLAAPNLKSPVSQALRDLQNQHLLLQRECRRKEKALAEAAALLVLQKNFRALWEDEGT